MDDWISLVYGRRRTFKAKSVPVMHHTGAHGQRYTVDQANGQKLTALVESGECHSIVVIMSTISFDTSLSH